MINITLRGESPFESLVNRHQNGESNPGGDAQSSAPTCRFLQVMMDDYDYSIDFAADGADMEATLEAGGATCAVRFPHDDWMVNAVEDLPHWDDPDNDESYLVPLWATLVCFQHTFKAGTSLVTYSAPDSLPHPQTLA